jgi:glycerol-3-phosphate dehydrogenase (NAD(P)+)
MSNSQSDQADVAVVGGGAWGIALAAAAGRQGKVLLLSRREVGSVPANVHVSKDFAALRDTRLIVLAVPSSVALSVAREVGDHTDGSHYIVHGVRGLVGERMDTISEVLTSQVPTRRLGALGGPALADEILKGKPSVLVCGTRFPELAKKVSSVFGSESLRVYSTTDIKGLEWASALVGCMAVSIGFAKERDMGAGLIAALICRSMGEAARIAAEAGGDERTLLGLGGYGDLLASIEQEQRPEVRLGRAMAKGSDLNEVRSALGERVEAVELIPRILAWTASRGVRAPIFEALAKGLTKKLTPDGIVQELMTLPVLDAP